MKRLLGLNALPISPRLPVTLIVDTALITEPGTAERVSAVLASLEAAWVRYEQKTLATFEGGFDEWCAIWTSDASWSSRHGGPVVTTVREVQKFMHKVKELGRMPLSGEL